MRKKSNFELNYPLFVNYFNDELVRDNMINNKDLKRKYEAHTELISTLIFELEKRFDKFTINNILTETVLKLPDEVLTSFIVSYLNSNESTKSNPNVVSFYNKILHLGNSSIEYIEENGIITNRTYKDLPVLIINNKYHLLKCGNEHFKNELLDDVFDTLSFEEKKYVIMLLEHKCLDILNLLFVNIEISFKDLIDYLMKAGINNNIINNEVYSNIQEKLHLLLICELASINNKEVTEATVKLINEKRYSIVTQLILNKVLNHLLYFSNEDLMSMNDNLIIEFINNNYNLVKKED